MEERKKERKNETLPSMTCLIICRQSEMYYTAGTNKSTPSATRLPLES